MIKRAIISVSDKTGIVEFARGIILLGYEIVSTGGTARVLREDDIEVTDVSEVTKFPECLDGRVKTLHPGVLAGVLAKGNDAHETTMAELGLPYFDLVVVNFYPFREAVSDRSIERHMAIEQIDIGGPTMVRAAAKNADRVTVIIDPSDYDMVLEQLQQPDGIDWVVRRRLQLKVFQHTAEYDRAIAQYLAGEG